MKTFVVLFLIIASTLAFGQSAPALSKGQVLYLPVYSHIWYGDLDKKGKPDFLLFSALVSIRNTDPARPIRIVSAQYYDTEGKRLKEFIASPITIKPLATYELYIAKSDTAGGS